MAFALQVMGRSYSWMQISLDVYKSVYSFGLHLSCGYLLQVSYTLGTCIYTLCGYFRAWGVCCRCHWSISLLLEDRVWLWCNLAKDSEIICNWLWLTDSDWNIFFLSDISKYLGGWFGDLHWGSLLYFDLYGLFFT